MEKENYIKKLLKKRYRKDTFNKIKLQDLYYQIILGYKNPTPISSHVNNMIYQRFNQDL